MMTIAPPPTLPSTSYALLPSPGGAEVSLQWSPSFTSQHAVERYRVSVTPDPSSCSSDQVSPSENYSCSGLVLETPYTFTLSAINCGDWEGNRKSFIIDFCGMCCWQMYKKTTRFDLMFITELSASELFTATALYDRESSALSRITVVWPLHINVNIIQTEFQNSMHVVLQLQENFGSRAVLCSEENNTFVSLNSIITMQDFSRRIETHFIPRAADCNDVSSMCSVTFLLSSIEEGYSVNFSATNTEGRTYNKSKTISKLQCIQQLVFDEAACTVINFFCRWYL